MKIEKFSLGILGANCYLLINEETKDTVVVDPGGHSKKFTAYIEEEKLNLVAILLTHGHFDHIMGIDSILENWNIPVYVEEEDLPIMTDPEFCRTYGFPEQQSGCNRTFCKRTTVRTSG